MIPAHEPDRADTNVLQYSTAEKLFLIALSEKATTDPILMELSSNTDSGLIYIDKCCPRWVSTNCG